MEDVVAKRLAKEQELAEIEKKLEVAEKNQGGADPLKAPLPRHSMSWQTAPLQFL